MRPRQGPSMTRFNPRSPRGERRVRGSGGFAMRRFQSTLPARGATQDLEVHHGNSNVSIHAPRAGSDVESPYYGEYIAVSIHAPRAGSDHNNAPAVRRSYRFQSTLPARGATLRGRVPLEARPGFNPRSPRGERREAGGPSSSSAVFQSTLPARGATSGRVTRSRQWSGFQSTLPARGATASRVPRGSGLSSFNPRSPRGERPSAVCSTGAGTTRFNPRSPRGERPSSRSFREGL